MLTWPGYAQGDTRHYEELGSRLAKVAKPFQAKLATGRVCCDEFRARLATVWSWVRDWRGSPQHVHGVIMFWARLAIMWAGLETVEARHARVSPQANLATAFQAKLAISKAWCEYVQGEARHNVVLAGETLARRSSPQQSRRNSPLAKQTW